MFPRKKAIRAWTSPKKSRASMPRASASSKNVTIAGADAARSRVRMLISDPPMRAANSGWVSPANSRRWRKTWPKALRNSGIFFIPIKYHRGCVMHFTDKILSSMVFPSLCAACGIFSCVPTKRQASCSTLKESMGCQSLMTPKKSGLCRL